jgi:hypothetical protein
MLTYNNNPDELTENYKTALQSKYCVLDNFSLIRYDRHFELLEKHLGSIIKSQYDPNDRIVIDHFDTDYYLDGFPYGLGLYNLFTVFRKLDIPLYVMLLVTNHYGIAKEVNCLAPDPCDRPTIIETFVSKLHYASVYNNHNVDADMISVPGLCMLGQGRVHRHAIFRFIESELMDHIALSTNPT